MFKLFKKVKDAVVGFFTRIKEAIFGKSKEQVKKETDAKIDEAAKKAAVVMDPVIDLLCKITDGDCLDDKNIETVKVLTKTSNYGSDEKDADLEDFWCAVTLTWAMEVFKLLDGASLSNGSLTLIESQKDLSEEQKDKLIQNIRLLAKEVLLKDPESFTANLINSIK